MAVAYRSTASVTNTSGTDASSITVNKPAGTVDGDLMVMVVGGPQPGTLTTPTGWTKVAGPVSDGTGLSSWVFKKIAASEGANYLVSWGATVTGAMNASISSFTGASDVNDWSYAITTTNTAAAGRAIVPSRTAMRYNVHCWRAATTDSVTWSIGTAETHDVTAKDSGTIWRGQSAVYASANNSPGVAISANTATLAAAPAFGIQWSLAISASMPANESWSTTGYDNSGANVELQLSGTWTDVTSKVRMDGGSGIEITRGRSAEGSNSDPSTCRLTLDNRDGRFSMRNPTGAYYGSLTRNTPLRVSKSQGTVAVDLMGTGSSNGGAILDSIWPWGTADIVYAPAVSAMDVTGDIDIRLDIEPETWRQDTWLASRCNSSNSAFDVFDGGELNAWALLLNNNGTLTFMWSSSGDTMSSVTSTQPVPMQVRGAVRVTLDVNNGAAGNTATFYSSDTISGTWTQVGDAVVSSGVTSIAANAANLRIGFGVYASSMVDISNLDRYDALHGRVYGIQVLNGIGGSAVVNADFTSATTGSYSFTDSTSIKWYCVNNSVISNRKYRFYGEVAEWPVRWNQNAADSWVDIEGAGIMRRLGARSSQLRSPMYRAAYGGIYKGAQTVCGPAVAHWPMEDGSKSAALAASTSGVNPMSYSFGSPTFQASTSMAASTGMVDINSAVLSANVPTYTAGADESWVSFLLDWTSTSASSVYVISVSLSTGDTASFLLTPSTGSCSMQITDSTGTATVSTGSGTITRKSIVTMAFVENGANYNGYAFFRSEGDASPTQIGSPTIAWPGNPIVKRAQFNPNNSTITSVYVGHLAVWAPSISINPGAADSSSDVDWFTLPVTAYQGESAGVRCARLLKENGITPLCIGTNQTYPNITSGGVYVDPTGELMGTQPSATLLEIMRDAETADSGILFEPRDSLSLAYRGRITMHNQAAALALDYSSNHLSDCLNPVDDDSFMKNDVTVTRTGGSSARYTVTTGPVSTASPPNGVGVYDDAFDVSLYTDAQCLDVASWAAHLGTVDEPRYPKIVVDGANPRMSASASLWGQALRVDIGDRITVTTPPSPNVPPETIAVLVQGYNEVFDRYTHKITYNCAPASPWDVARTVKTGSGTSSTSKVTPTYGTATLSVGATSSATSLSVASTGALFTTGAVNFDVMVAGERMTVTNISGSSSPQTFTVTRAVNGVSKAQSAGAVVKLFKPAFTAQ